MKIKVDEKFYEAMETQKNNSLVGIILTMAAWGAAVAALQVMEAKATQNNIEAISVKEE